MLPFPALLQVAPAAISDQTAPRQPGAVLCLEQEGTARQEKPFDCQRAMPGARQGEKGWSTAKPPFSSPLFPTSAVPGETAANRLPLPQRGSRDVLEPAPAAPAAGSNSILPHPRALGHNDQVSPHQVRGPTLPCLPAHGKSSSPGRAAIPDAALPVGTAPTLPGGGGSQGRRVQARAHSLRLRTRTHTQGMPR